MSGLVEEIRRCVPSDLVILFVDDSSPDGTADEVRKISSHDTAVKLLLRESKKGIGTAYQDGFKEAITAVAPDIVIEMDADLQHPPSAIMRLVEAVKGGADVAVGSRYVAGGGILGWGLRRRTVSKGANFYARTMLGLKVRDATSGFRAYSRTTAERIATAGLPVKGFEFQVASLRLLRGLRITEVPYTFSARKLGKSKLGSGDMLRFFFSVLRIALGSRGRRRKDASLGPS